jgi:hypothetical protein
LIPTQIVEQEKTPPSLSLTYTTQQNQSQSLVVHNNTELNQRNEVVVVIF